MHKKRMSDEIFHVTEYGGEIWILGRADKYDTEESFIEAAKKYWDDWNGETPTEFQVFSKLVRINVEAPDGDYPFMLTEVHRKGPGVWKTWLMEFFP